MSAFVISIPSPGLRLFGSCPVLSALVAGERCDMLLPILCVAFAGLGNALSLTHKISPRQNGSAPAVGGSAAAPAAMTGVATFVDFVHEANTVCGPLSGMSETAS